MLRESNQRLSAASNDPKAFRASLWTLIRALLRREIKDNHDSRELNRTSHATDIPEFAAREYYDR